MKVIFPSDNILAELCNEQKFLKRYASNLSSIIPYCEIKTDVAKLQGAKFTILPTNIENNLLHRKCIAHYKEREFFVGNFILGKIPDDKNKQIAELCTLKKFSILSFKTFYTCELFIQTENYVSWQLKNIKWYKG